MNVIIFVGSARKKHTYQASQQLADNLRAKGDVEVEIIRLSDYALTPCTGCITCFDKGEEYCPFGNEISGLLKKIDDADGVVFATPNYAFHMSGLMKLFMDRISFNFHRPCFFGKSSTSLVTQAFYKGNDIMKYFSFVGKALGFNTVKGTCLISLEPMNEKQAVKNSALVDKLSERFYRSLVRKGLEKPSLFDLMIFRMSRNRVRILLNDNYRDFTYYRDKGWFESDFFYEVSLSPFMKMAGRFFDWLSVKTTKPVK